MFCRFLSLTLSVELYFHDLVLVETIDKRFFFLFAISWINFLDQIGLWRTVNIQICSGDHLTELPADARNGTASGFDLIDQTLIFASGQSS